MPERCRQCGRPTLDPRHDLCPQCFRGERNNRGNERSPGSRGLPAGYLADGYFDDHGYLRREIIVDDAQRVAAVLANAGLTSASLRRYFARLRDIAARYDHTRDFSAARVDLYALEPFVAYGVSRRVVPAVFQDFIKQNLALATKDEKHFRAFLSHCQSVVAFFKETDSRRRNR